MPYKSAFKRSILNVQPIKETSQRVTPQSLQDRAVPISTFVEADNHGFATTIGRQFPVKSDSADAVPLITGGISDSSLATKTASDPERPELISLTSPFAESVEGLREVLRIRDFESSVDEADLNFFYKGLSEGPYAKDVEKRKIEAKKLRNQLNSDLSVLMGIAEAIDRLRDNCSFVNGILPIHDGSTRFLQQLPKRFGNSPNAVIIEPSKTFIGLTEPGVSSSTALITLLAYTLLYPGSVRLTVPELGDSVLSSFAVPVVSIDPVNDLLANMGGLNVSEPEGFLQAESLLPQDPMSRIALISEALAYELGLSAGTSRIKSPGVIDYITNILGQSSSAISDPAKSGTVLACMRSGNNLPLEINDTIIGGTSYKGMLSAYIDGSIADGSLNFTELEKTSRNIVESLNKLVSDIKKLRLLDDTSESLTPMGIITMMAGYVAAGTSTLGNDISADRSKNQLAQLLLLKELASATTSGELLESRFRTFQAIIASGNELAQTENSDPNTENTQLSTSARRTNSGTNQGEKSSFKVTVDGKSSNIEIENTTQSSVSTSISSANRKNSISSSTTGSSRASYRTSASGKSNYATSQSRSTKGSKASSTSSERVSSDDAIDSQASEQQIYRTFTGKGGSGHIASTFDSNFDSSPQSPASSAAKSSNLFEKFGLSFGVASILGLKDLVVVYLTGENVNVEAAVSTVANNAIKVVPESDSEFTSNEVKVTQQETADIEKVVISSTKQYIPPYRKNGGSVIGLTSVLNQEGQTTSPYGSPITRPNRSPVIKTTIKNSTTEPNAESLFGLSVNSSNIPDNTASKQNFDTTVNQASKVKSRTTDDSESILDMIVAFGASSGSIERSTSTVGKSVTPQSDMSQLNSEVRSFLTLFPNAEGSSSSSFGFSISSIKDTLRLANSEADALLSGEYRKFVQSLIETAGELAGDTEKFANGTTNYGLTRSAIEFLCFSMFTSMCTLLGGVQGSAASSASKGDFDVRIVFDSQKMFDLWTSINKLSLHSGPLMEFVQSSVKTPELSKLVGSLRYADRVGEVLKVRYAVMQNFVNTYSAAVATFMNSMSTDTVVKTIANIRKSGSTDVLRDISQEAVSGAQLSAAYVRGPISLDRTTRQVRIAKRLSGVLFETFGVQGSLDSFIATVGVPSKSIEVLRRKQRQSSGKMTGNLQEYIEVTFSRQDLQFPDIVTRNVTARFCTRLEAIPTFTTGLSIGDCIKEFTYLCHDGSTWKQRNIAEAIRFVASVTGLDETSSYVVVANHAIDAICRCSSYAVGIPGSHEIGNLRSTPIISSSAASLALNIMRENRAMMAMMGGLLPGDFLEPVPGGYKFIRFSQLEKQAQRLTNESRHRLLGLVLSDPLFTYESLYNTGNCFNSLERIYNFIIDPDEFVIDKAKTLSTNSGKSAFERIVVDGMVDVYPNTAVFRDNAGSSLLNCAVYGAKVELVIS